MIGYRPGNRHLLMISHHLASMTYEVTLFGQIAKGCAIAFPVSCVVCAVFLTGNNRWWWLSSSWIYRHIDLYGVELLISVSMPVLLAGGILLLGTAWLVIRAFVRYGLHEGKCS